MAFQFLGVENCDRPFEFCRRLGLFFPKAVRHFFIDPPNQIRRYDVRNAARHALPFLHVEVTGRRFRIRPKSRDAHNIRPSSDFIYKQLA